MARFRFELQVAAAFKVEAVAEEDLLDAASAMAHGVQVASELSKAEPMRGEFLRVVDDQGNELLKIPIGN